MLPWLLPASGCQSSARPAPLPVAIEDNTARLIKHPQFPLAARAAPDFTTEALATIRRLQKDLANAGH